MKIDSPKVLASFSTPGLCEGCGKPCLARERHHVFTKGAGCPDLRCVIIMLGEAFECQCHAKFHGKALASERARFLKIIAEREGTTPEAIEELVNLIRNELPKGASPWLIAEMISRMSADGEKLAKRELSFVRVI
jgi:hypothetical protein